MLGVNVEISVSHWTSCPFLTFNVCWIIDQVLESINIIFESSDDVGSVRVVGGGCLVTGHQRTANQLSGVCRKSGSVSFVIFQLDDQ